MLIVTRAYGVKNRRHLEAVVSTADGNFKYISRSQKMGTRDTVASDAARYIEKSLF